MSGEKKTIGFIGTGNMGWAIMSALTESYSVVYSEKDPKAAQKVKKALGRPNLEFRALADVADILVLAVKPQNFDEVLAALSPHVTPRHLVISIAAGVTTESIERGLPPGTHVVRTMPNLAARVREGVTGMCAGRNTRVEDIRETRKIFKHVGRVHETEEPRMDAVTALTGSGPAYLFHFVECLETAAREIGFGYDAKDLVTQTLRGALRLYEESGESAAKLRERVTSKGGTTEAALKVLEEREVSRAYTDAVKAALRRAGELSG